MVTIEQRTWENVMKLIAISISLIACFASIAIEKSACAQARGADEMQDLVEEAYIYGLPIIMSYKTMYFYAVNKDSPEYKSPFNQITNIARVYGPDDKAVVSPNSDTPYSVIWMDLRAEPVVLTIPKIEKKRYFSVMLQDLSTYLLPYIGSRTTGNDGGTYLICGPNWKGEKPEGVDEVMRSQSEFVFTAYRTQLFNPTDLESVKSIQRRYGVQTLSKFLGKKDAPSVPAIEFLPWNENAATGDEFIKYLNFLLQFIEPDKKEKELIAKLGSIGVGAGRAFDFNSLSTEQKSAVRAGVESAKARINEKSKKTPIAGHSAEDYEHDWLLRAVVTQVGWGANDPREASYPMYRTDAEGEILDGSKNSYTLTFAKGAFPPVRLSGRSRCMTGKLN